MDAEIERILTDSHRFHDWWQTRRPSEKDRRILSVAIERGLVNPGRTIISLTAAGIRLRAPALGHRA